MDCQRQNEMAQLADLFYAQMKQPQQQKKLKLFIDNSNLFHEAQKLAADKLFGGSRDVDPRFRINTRQLQTWLEETLGGKVIDAILYTSSVTPEFAVTGAAERAGFKVKNIVRPASGEEKEVDTQIVADAVESVTELDLETRYGIVPQAEKDNTVLVIVSGDRDMRPAIIVSLNRGIPVVIVAFTQSMSQTYRDMAAKDPEMVKLVFLDNHIFTVGFIDVISTFKTIHNTKHTLVVEGALLTQQVMDTLLKELNNIYFYVTCPELLVDFAFPIDAMKTPNVLMIEFPTLRNCDAKLKLRVDVALGRRYSVISFDDWMQKFSKTVPAAPLSKGKFSVLSSDDDDEDSDDTTSIDGGDTDDEKEEKEEEEEEEKVEEEEWETTVKSRIAICAYGVHCPDGLKCTLRHSRRDIELFDKYSFAKRSVFKSVLCKNQTPHDMAHCHFSHGKGKDEVWCSYCKKSDHLNEACPCKCK
jgi:hypothetical protein